MQHFLLLSPFPAFHLKSPPLTPYQHIPSSSSPSGLPLPGPHLPTSIWRNPVIPSIFLWLFLTGLPHNLLTLPANSASYTENLSSQFSFCLSYQIQMNNTRSFVFYWCAKSELAFSLTCSLYLYLVFPNKPDCSCFSL